MNSLFVFTDILKSLARIESQVANLNNTFTSVEPRTPIDDALVDQFLAKAAVLAAAAEQLKQVVYVPPTPEV
jgi:hypothetical protein